VGGGGPIKIPVPPCSRGGGRGGGGGFPRPYRFPPTRKNYVVYPLCDAFWGRRRIRKRPNLAAQFPDQGAPVMPAAVPEVLFGGLGADGSGEFRVLRV